MLLIDNSIPKIIAKSADIEALSKTADKCIAGDFSIVDEGRHLTVYTPIELAKLYEQVSRKTTNADQLPQTVEDDIIRFGEAKDYPVPDTVTIADKAAAVQADKDKSDTGANPVSGEQTFSTILEYAEYRRTAGASVRKTKLGARIGELTIETNKAGILVWSTDKPLISKLASIFSIAEKIRKDWSSITVEDLDQAIKVEKAACQE